MAEKNSDKADADFEFVTWESPAKANPYTDLVQKLADRNDESAGVTITVDAKEAANRQLLFQKAANAIGKTARLRHTDTSGSRVTGQTAKGRDIREGVVKLTFTLTEKHAQRRGKDEAPEAAPAAVAEAVAE